MAASQADERSRAEQPCRRRVESGSKLLQRAVHVARVRSGYDERNEMRKRRVRELLASSELVREVSGDVVARGEGERRGVRLERLR